MQEISRITNFRSLGLGFFIHFGLYNKLQKGEWFMNMYDLSLDKYYSKIGDLGNISLDIKMDEIVKLAKENGFGYIIFTSKHHDGFCLFDSKKTSMHDILETKNKIDIIDLFIEKCVEYGIKPIIYYATWDWSWEEKNISFNDKLSKINEHINILCKKSKNIAGFWFDGNWSAKDNDWEQEKLCSLIRSYLPEALIVNNSGLSNSGKEQHIEIDSITFEQGHMKQIDYSKFKRDLFAEACQSFNDHWGYAKHDYNYKSLKEIITKFVDVRKQLANYAINISIDDNGKMLPIEVETIKKFGEWLKYTGNILLGGYEIIDSYQNGDFIIKKDNAYYIILYDIYSGGHVKEIQKGGGILDKRIYKFPFHLNKITYIDNQQNVIYKRKNNNLTILPQAMEYGFNTIFRVIKIV